MFCDGLQDRFLSVVRNIPTDSLRSRLEEMDRRIAFDECGCGLAMLVREALMDELVRREDESEES